MEGDVLGSYGVGGILTLALTTLPGLSRLDVAKYNGRTTVKKLVSRQWQFM